MFSSVFALRKSKGSVVGIINSIVFTLVRTSGHVAPRLTRFRYDASRSRLKKESFENSLATYRINRYIRDFLHIREPRVFVENRDRFIVRIQHNFVSRDTFEASIIIKKEIAETTLFATIHVEN